MMNAGNLKGKTRQMSDWRRRLLALVLTLSLLISSCGLMAFAESDEDIYSPPVTVPPEQSTSPDPAEGETAETPAPEGQTETGTEEGGETEGEPEESEEPEEPEEPEPVDLTVYEPGTLTAEADGIQVTLDYTAEARVPEGTVLTLARAAGGDLYSAMKSAAKVLRTEINETWQREMGDEAVFYAIALTNPEGNEVHPKAGVTLTCSNLIIPADATGFVTGDNAENIDWDGTLSVDFLPDAVGYAYLKQVQIGNITLVHEGADYTVTATYGPDAGFPAGTELKVREIMPGTDEYALYSGMTEEAVSEDWSEITLERYFDIAFVHGEEELEPNADVDVQITFKEAIELTDDHELQAVHIENNEATVIEAGTDSTEAAVSDEEAIDTVSFTSDSFSVFGVVRKTKIVTKVLDAQGNTYEIEVTYNQEAEIPENAQVKVDEIEEGSDLWEAYRKQTAAALNADDVRLPGLYDISIIDEEGNKVEPKAPVSVSIKLANAENTTEELHVVHFTEEMPQELIDAEAQQDEPAPEQLAEQPEEQQEEQTEVQDQPEEPASEQQDDQPEEKTIVQNSTDEPLQTIESEIITAKVEDDTVTFDTQGFSVYAFAYTVDFHYEDEDGNVYEWSYPGRGKYPVKDILAAIGGGGEITNVTLELKEGELVEGALYLTQDETGEWFLNSDVAFTDTYELSIHLGSKIYILIVTDAAAFSMTVNNFDYGYLMRGGLSNGVRFDVPVTPDRVLAQTSNGGYYSFHAVAKPNYVFSKWQLSNGYSTWDAQDPKYQNMTINGGDITYDQIYNQNLVFTAVFEPIKRQIGIEDYCSNLGQISPHSYHTGSIAYYDDYWNNGNGYNRDVIQAIPNSGYEFVCWNYYEETKHNEWTLIPSKKITQQRFEPGTFELNRDGKGWWLKAVFRPQGIDISVNDPSFGDVVDKDGNSCIGLLQPTWDGKLPKTIKAVSKDASKYVFGYWTLNGEILPITSNIIHPNDYPDIHFDNASNLQAVFAKVIDANESAHSNFTVSDDKKQQFQRWLDSLENDKKLSANKTAKVTDYRNRIYQIDISAESARIIPQANIGVAFILDASNSMQFPANLERTGKTIVLTQETMNLEFPGEIGPYYIISEPRKTATVYRIYKEDDTWKAIDASYYYDRNGQYSNKVWTLAGTNRYSDSDETQGTILAYPVYRDAGNKLRVDYLNSSLNNTITAMRDIVGRVNQDSYNISIAYTMFAAYTKHHYQTSNVPGKLGSFKTEGFQPLKNTSFTVNLGDTDGGTRHDLGLAEAIEYIDWQDKNIPNDQRYAILISDGAAVIPGGSTSTTWDGKTYSQVQSNIVAQANLLKGMDVKLITVGLSTKNVDGGSQVLKNIASPRDPSKPNGEKLFFEAESGEDLENILYEILQTVVKNGTSCGQIIDEVDEAFYPLDKYGKPIPRGTTYYKNDGTRLKDKAEYDALGDWEPRYMWVENNGKWKIIWEHQYIGFDPLDPDYRKQPWHGTFCVKAKENFLGGNTISTNHGDCEVIEDGYNINATINNSVGQGGWTLNGDDKPSVNLPTPYVNVDELKLTGNNTEWTVYLGTSVNPLEQLNDLLKKIQVLKVVTKDELEVITDDGIMLDGTDIDRSKRFDLSSVVDGLDSLTGADWLTLINSGTTIEKTYGDYGHTGVGKIVIRLTRNETKDDEDGLNPSPHDTTVVGDGVEKYTFTVTYIPEAEQNPEGGWHTTPGGSRGAVTDNMESTNEHEINVFVKGLRVEKKDTQGQLITTGEAKFKLYTKVADGTAGAEVLKVNDTDVTVQQFEGVLTTTAGILTIDQLAYPKEGIYYLVETEAPEGYIRRTEPMVIQLTLSDLFWAWNKLEANAVGILDETLKPYNWKQTLTGECNETPIAEDPVGLFNVIVPNTEKTSLTVKKNWGDGQYPPEGAEIKAKLTAKVEESLIDDEAIKELTGLTDLMVTLNGGKKVEEEYTGNDTIEKPWEYLWTDLPKYDEAKHEVSYSAIETSYKIDNQTIDLEKYEPTLTPGTQELIITNKLPKTERHAIKVWDDDGEEDRPASITFTLTAKVGEIPIEGDDLINEGIVRTEVGKEQSAEQTMSGPAWTQLDWTDLPVYTKAGKLITYDIVESSLEDYTLILKSWDNDTKTIATFTNKIGKTSVELPGIKTMNGGEMPGIYSFILSAANGTPMPESKNLVVGETQTTLTVQNTRDEFTFGSIVYKLSNMTGATPVEGEEEHKTEKTFTYTVTEKNDAQSGIIYDETIYTVAIKVIYDNQTGTLKLADGYPAYSKTVGAVTTTEGISSIAFENKEVTEVNITKAWQKNGSTEAPQDVTISLGLFDKTDLNTLIKAVKLNGREDVAENPTGTQELITTAGNYEDAYEDSAWHATWKNLRKYDGNGNEIEYVVKEIPELSGYTVIYSGEGDPSYVKTGGTVTNKLNETNVKIVKVKAKPDGTTEPLTGAIFTLTKIDENNNAIDTPITIDLTEKSEDTVNNLTDGKYRLEETQVPAGFIGLGAPIIFTITEGKVDQPDLSGVTTIQYTKETDETDATFTIGNTPGTPLPSTGGSGTLIYTIVGAFLIALAGVLLVSRRKRKA